MRNAAVLAYRNIGLMCRAGFDVATLSPMLCSALRTYIGAAAVAIFWMDEAGMPAGFHHEDSPPGTRELFANEFDRLFTGPDEINVAHLSAARNVQRLGVLIAPPVSYYRSNTFNLLVRPSGHHHTLDLRIDVKGQTRIVVLAFRDRVHPFSASDAHQFRHVEPHLVAALRAPSLEHWNSQGAIGHLIVDEDARTIRFLDAAGEHLLRQCSLVGQEIRLTGTITAVPRFVEDLCRRTGAGEVLSAMIAIPSGRLDLTAERLQTPDTGDRSAFIVSIARQVPASLEALHLVMPLKLSPTQKQLVIAAARGTGRGTAGKALGLSSEAMKKHLAMIFATLDVHGWDEIAQRIRNG